MRADHAAVETSQQPGPVIYTLRQWAGAEYGANDLAESGAWAWLETTAQLIWDNIRDRWDADNLHQSIDNVDNKGSFIVL